MKTISRRAFLKTTATGASAAAIAGGNVFGQEKAGTQCPSSSESLKSFETPPAAIPETSIAEKISVDIVIIGAGVSGITAALSAAEAGVKSIVIEKHSTYNCRGGDNAAIDSRLHKKLGIKIDKDQIILELMKYCGNKIDQRLLRLWADNSGQIMDWMMSKTEAAGIETTIKQWPYPASFNDDNEYYKEFPVCHEFTGGQAAVLKVLVNEATSKGVEIRYNTRAVQLVRRDNGRVEAVIAQDKAGHYQQYNASKAVILCTGDYGHDREMMQKYCPWAAESARGMNLYSPPVNTGDGHKMAMWIGGVMEPAPHAPMNHTGGGPMGTDAFLHVNTLGERYENEDVPCQSLSNSLLRQPEKTFWQVYDSNWKNDIPKMGIGLLKYGDPAAPGWSGKAECQADTIEELAEKMNVPVAAFTAAVARYNELAKMGIDLDFGKRADRLIALEHPPYYAGKAMIAFLIVVGGLNVNPKLQPLDANRKVIPGLYLAGNTVGNRFANDYPSMCPGLSHGFAWTTGYLAGRNAAAERI
jgi:fumarate reductase flavoprotein subunit